MVLAGYFLSRGTIQNKETGELFPPVYLDTTKWEDAYLMFYRSLGAGRTWPQFHHSLKNTRDSFDSHLNSGRVGWRKPSVNGQKIREPQNLSKRELKILEKWKNASDNELWDAVRTLVNFDIKNISPEHFDVVVGELESEKGYDATVSRTEGGKKVITSRKAERSRKSRNDALDIHGPVCMVCGFDFGQQYGPWGRDYAIVHHMSPLEGGIRKTNPLTDLAVVCGNCHAMIHRKKGITLTLEELRSKMNR